MSLLEAPKSMYVMIKFYGHIHTFYNTRLTFLVRGDSVVTNL